MPPSDSLFYQFHFYFFGIVAIAAAITFVTRKSPVSAALWLVVVMFALAAEYVLLGAHFIGAIQVLVYAGAIMVVFLFVVMLLNLGTPADLADTRGLWWKLSAGALGVALVSLLTAYFRAPGGIAPVLARSLDVGYLEADVARRGAVGSVAEPLFREYLLAFELTSVLLLAAIVGAVALGRRKERSELAREARGAR
ncbi:MAG: NADH-ubiquinone oxidoreductase chain J [uncultured Gemmatimonadaceae bacterium]|uniref:NADH-quinone oxidoreductase subunit J n=1 Tax=uncultured Gemmatimonadaceae bacterium TaxID=246130 RepID=A0A6J4MMX8_9BACT|nr:MAG: NADH-ubiquinone oxidoreductase chain J [uncultured Gemmatimonadaceae bacterium]